MLKTINPWKITSVISIWFLIVIILKEQYFLMVIHRFTPPPPTSELTDYQTNPSFVEQTSFHALHCSPKKIVMLGNSHVFRMQWDELLGREDVANRGIGSDIIKGFYHRLPLILQLNPHICFIEGGVNDIEKQVPIDSSIKYLKEIVNTFQKKSIIPVVIKIIHVSESYPEAASFNQQIRKFNLAIDTAFSGRVGVRILDLNPLMCPNGVLLPRYSQQDGIHLTPPAYLIWKQQIQSVLAGAGI